MYSVSLSLWLTSYKVASYGWRYIIRALKYLIGMSMKALQPSVLFFHVNYFEHNQSKRFVFYRPCCVAMFVAFYY